MPKYLFQASYTREGVKGLLEEGGSSRAKALDEVAKSVGGKIDAFYYAFGDDDLLVIADLADDATAAAVSLRVSSAGAISVKTTVLLDPATIDAAAAKTVSYRPPGG